MDDIITYEKFIDGDLSSLNIEIIDFKKNYF